MNIIYFSEFKGRYLMEVQIIKPEHTITSGQILFFANRGFVRSFLV